jgi:hypothetical protein
MPKTLHNGIVLPDPWPPVREPAYAPMPVPYLEPGNIPDVIPIDVGRQLFVDDFLVEAAENLERTYHPAEYHPTCPVIRPDRPWETFQEGDWDKVGSEPAPEAHRKERLFHRSRPTAHPFSDGAWWDPDEKIFKMWYQCGFNKATAYAVSRDAVHWEKPDLDVEPGTNIVLRHNRDSAAVWLDNNEKNPAHRYKMFVTEMFPDWNHEIYALVVRTSPDGIHWSGRLTSPVRMGDRSTVHYDPFRGVWVFGIRHGHEGIRRSRCYRETTDPLADWSWDASESHFWVGADPLDLRHPDPKLAHENPQLYNLDCMAYESITLGQFCIWQGEYTEPVGAYPKRNEIKLGFSRDGYHFDRPDRRPFMGVNMDDPEAWNWGNVQSVGGGCLIVGDRLHFHCSGWSRSKDPGKPCPVLTTGMATLRRDGFASMDAREPEGTLTTRPVRFDGKFLFVNVDGGAGELRAEVLGADGAVIEPFSREHCAVVRSDSTRVHLHWSGAADLSSLSGQAVRFRFHLRNAKLYAFWVSPEPHGASQGYVAAGGPGFNGAKDE